MADEGSVDGIQLSFSRTDDFVLVSKPKTAIAFVEARLRSDLAASPSKNGYRHLLVTLERELSPPKLSDETVIKLQSDLLKDPNVNTNLPRGMFDSVRVVEFQGLDEGTRFVSAGEVAIKVHIYGFETLDDVSGSQYGSILALPSPDLDGLWESLMLDDNERTQLSSVTTNFFVLTRKVRDLSARELHSLSLSPIISLHGSKGTGKTSLARAFAQKLAIRNRSQFLSAKLLEVNVSKLAEGGVNFVDSCFEYVDCLTDTADSLLVVMFDNVELILGTVRDSKSSDASNPLKRLSKAFLCGADSLTHKRPNVFIVCTSSDPDSLDHAYLGRVIVSIDLGVLTSASVYAVLCRQLQQLIRAEVILTEDALPEWRDAVLEEQCGDITPGVRLVQVAQHLSSQMSARFVSEFVMQRLVTRLLHGTCNLDEAIGLLLDWTHGDGMAKRSLDELEGTQYVAQSMALANPGCLLEHQCDDYPRGNGLPVKRFRKSAKGLRQSEDFCACRDKDKKGYNAENCLDREDKDDESF